MERALSLKTLQRVARVPRRLGLHAVVDLGRFLLRRLPVGDLAVEFDGLRMMGSVSHRLHLYQVAAAEMEPFMTELFVRALRPGLTVLDIGAHLGYYTLLAARAGARVYAFEPDQRTFACLTRNVRANGFTGRVTLVPKAVSDRPSRVPFFLTDNPAHSGLLDDATRGRTTIVDQICLDEFLGDAVTADIIKMDIQGAELLGLRGMERTLARSGGLTMFIECWPEGLRAAGASANELIAYLHDRGFAVQVIDERNRRLVPVDTDIETVLYVNLLCTRS